MLLGSDELVQRVGGKDLVGWHRSNGKDVTPTEYRERYRRVLHSGLSSTRLLYLDTNYWVRLRDAELGCGTQEAVNLLQTLRAMVRSREIICVGHLYSFLEIGKQEEASLRATARLLDEMSEAIAIASPADLLTFECAEFIGDKLGLQVHDGLCVWTKAGLIHKHDLPKQMPGPTTLAGTNVILKALIDTLWNASYEDIFGAFEWKTKSRLDANISPQVLAQVEQMKKEQQSKGLLREQVRLYGFSQVVSAQLRPVFTDQLRQWHIQNRFPDGISAILYQLRTLMNTAEDEFKAGTLGRLLACASIPVELYTLYETAYSRKCQLPAYRIHLIAGIKEPGYSRHIGASGCAA